jgi:microcystin degradation protein MlrC
MVPDFCDDGEGYLLKLLRADLGADIPIAVTLDLHAMVSEDMVRHAQIFVSYKTYPHVDMREIGAHAARILDRAMKGEIAPRTVRAHVPMLDEVNSGRTDIPETLALYDRARQAEAQGLLAVSVNSGFTGADVSCVGPTVLATYDRNAPGAEAAARHVTEELADRIWQGRTKKRTFSSRLTRPLPRRWHGRVTGRSSLPTMPTIRVPAPTATRPRCSRACSMRA